MYFAAMATAAKLLADQAMESGLGKLYLAKNSAIEWRSFSAPGVLRKFQPKS